MLLDKIRKANMEALKTKNSNARAIYSVLINKCQLLEIEKKQKKEDLADLDVTLLIQRTLNELEEEKQSFLKVNNIEKVKLIEEQANYLKVYLPEMLTKDEIIKEIISLESKDIGIIMKHFIENFAGKVNMKQVSEIARNIQD